ncbi:hypothetical protein QYE76_009837 [Lolium multiflorum]|uniref:Uncharacterized protein n=1 Tax=Lolium multiflorum TaxID=4521 RepID=A0AAD8X2H7_LOLMU|nr:hypothetical protein QYE76_009837 [Lolium multiflorum]
MCLTRRFRSGDWGGDHGGASPARRNRAAARAQGGRLSGRNPRAAPGNRFSPLAGRCSDADEPEPPCSPMGSAVSSSPDPIRFGAFLPPLFAPEERLHLPRPGNLLEQGLQSSLPLASPALDGEDFPPLPRAAHGVKPPGAPSAPPDPPPTPPLSVQPTACAVQVGSVLVHLPSVAPPSVGCANAPSLGFAPDRCSWAEAQAGLRGPAHFPDPLRPQQPSSGLEPLDERQLSQGHFGRASMDREDATTSSNKNTLPPPAYKWLWLPPQTLDPLLGFPAPPHDIRRNRSRAKLLLLRPDPVSGTTLPLLSAMDRDRDRASRGKRSYDDLQGGYSYSRNRDLDLRQKLDREQEEHRRQQRARDHELDRAGQSFSRRHEDPRPHLEDQRLPPPPPGPRGREPGRNPARRAPRQPRGLSGTGPSQSHSTTTAVATSNLPGPDAVHITCYNCGKQGHVQADCVDEPFCLKCKKLGHLSAMCASFSRGPDPFWAGFGCGQKGFFCCDVPEEEMHQPVANAATVIIEGRSLSEEELDGELKDLVDETWDWQVRKINDTDFAVVFPSKESLRMAIRGGGPTLPTSKCKALVTVPTGDPLAVEQLEEVWVRLHGVPPPLRHADRLLMITREIGRPVGVDTSSLSHPLQPIRMSFGCRVPVILPSHVMLFANMQGFRVQVEREAHSPGNSPPQAPLPHPPKDKGDDKEEDNDETDEDRWDGRRGRHSSREKSPASAPAGGAGGLGKKTTVAAPICAGAASSPISPSTYRPLDTLPVQASLPASAFNQYGSNLTAGGDIFPAVAKIIQQALATPRQETATISDTEQPSLSLSVSNDTTEGPKNTGQSYRSPFKAKQMPAEDRAEVGWVSPSSDEERSAKERRSKTNNDRPSRRAMIEDKLASRLDFDEAVVEQNSPTAPTPLHVAPAILSPRVEPRCRQLLLEDAPIPALGATVARAPRSKATPVEATRKSARGKGLTEGTVLQRAILLKNAADKDSDTSTPAKKAASPATTGFGRRGRRTLLKDYLRLHKIDLVFLQETIKQDFTDTELRSLEIGDKFFWNWLPANGHSGGMLVGARDSTFEVGTFDRGQFYLSLSILHRASNRIVEAIGIYGPADHGRSREFLEEISNKLSSCTRPVLMGGDFNLIRAATDKNNNNLYWPLIDLFNDHIANWALRELPRTGARYTWTNKQINPVRSVLDRVFVSPEFETIFPLCSLSAETSLGSDHTPLVLDTGEGTPVRSNRFFFETGWLEMQGFPDMVLAQWELLSSRVRGRDIIDWWVFMSAGLRQHLKVVKGMKSDTAPGPAGFPIIFFKRFWSLVKHGVLHILNDFVLGRIDIARLNFGVLSLIPKVPGADLITQFRPIALINVIFKIISRAYASRLDPIANRVISPNQTAFIKGRNILEGPLALIEVIHELRSKKLGGILLKLDFEKAYDRVNWDFLAEVLRRKGFNEAYIHRIMQLVSGGQTAISINGEIGPYFRNKPGVRQGDPLSPLLFNFIGEALSGILTAASEAGHIHGVVPHLIPGGISHLQYADDTLILIQNDEQSILNLKFLLLCFEDMSGLKINFHKSEVIVLDAHAEEQTRIANKFNCKQGAFPFIYLGLPISDRKLSLEQWLFLVRRLASKLEPWVGRLLSSGGRLVLSNSCLDNLPMFAMGLFLLQDGIHVKFDSIRSRFFWEGAGPKRKYHMVNWPSVCRPKPMGGLDLLNTKKMNVALLLKWVWKLYQPDGSIWANLIRAKYEDADNIFAGSGQGGSQFWKAIHKIKHFFKVGAKHEVRNGTRTSFWSDWWLGDAPLKVTFPHLFAIGDNPSISVSAACHHDGLNIRFRRSLDQQGMTQWRALQAYVVHVQLDQGLDTIRWHLEPSGQYSVKSMYAKLSQGTTVAHHKDMWETKVPLKVKIFSWQLALDKLPTCSQIATRQGPSNGACSLLLWVFFLAQSWALWLIRNKLTIERKIINHPADVLYKIVILLQLWSTKFKGRDKEGLTWMANELRELYASMRPRN